MNKKLKKLKLEMTIFALFVFIFLGVILVTEKTSTLLIPKVQTKLDSYIKENYGEIEKNINKSKVTYKATKFTMKITDKNNKYHYFYIYYKDRKITDTYQIDYLEAKKLMKHIETKIQKEINIELNNSYKVSIDNKLNDYNEETQNNIIKENNLSTLRIYKLKKTINTDNITLETISQEIYNNIVLVENKNIKPRTYEFKFIDNNNANNVLTISNITYKFINNDNYTSILNDIIEGKNSSQVRNSKIKFEYKN